MKGQTCAAADPSTILGLKLSGVKEVFVWISSDDPSKLRDWFQRMVRGGMGVMIISQDCARTLSKELMGKRVSGAMAPVVVVLPGEEEDTRALEMMRRAVGLDHGQAAEGKRR
jgi:vacuolar-type H+-ATPase subunit F/Vma7